MIYILVAVYVFVGVIIFSNKSESMDSSFYNIPIFLICILSLLWLPICTVEYLIKGFTEVILYFFDDKEENLYRYDVLDSEEEIKMEKELEKYYNETHNKNGEKNK